MSTAEDNGVLLYNGDNEPIAVELHQGHVRVTYDPGNQPATTIYRYTHTHRHTQADGLQDASCASRSGHLGRCL